jgi:preprotein translocase subunit SecD
MKFTFKIILLIFFLAVALVAISPWKALESGVLIKSVSQNSTAYNEGLAAGEILHSINGNKISSLADFSNASAKVFNLEPADFEITALDNGMERIFNYTSFSIDFNVNNLTIVSVQGNAAAAGLKENFTLLKVNGENISSDSKFNDFKVKLEPKIKLTLVTDKKTHIFYASSQDFTVIENPTSNLKAGLDLQGGAKALVRPEQKLNAEEMTDLIRVTKERLNVYGIADINVRSATDLSGNSYMVVEVAGATPGELKDLIGKQGKFEAKIGNDTVFIGGKKDITSVCKNDPSCSAIRECYDSQSGSSAYCKFDFAIYLSPEAAKRQAALTANLSINLTQSGERMLSKTLDLYLDDNLVDTLSISESLKGKEATQISISGPGYGATKTDAYNAAQANMAKLQTILITGSLPYKLEIVKLDNISPLLGKQFVNNILLAALAAAIGVALVVFIRYRKISFTVPVVLTVLSEIFIILGMAALIRWNLDLASIAGIIAAIGTGVDAQVIIIDESRKTSHESSLKERIKGAFFIILGSFSTVVVAMLPLFWAGAGMMKGFALTTIMGAFIGVFITRPAFSDIISQITKE